MTRRGRGQLHSQYQVSSREKKGAYLHDSAYDWT